MSQLFRWTLIVLAIVGVPTAALSLLLGVFSSGAGLVLGLVLGAVYTAVIVLVLRAMPIWPVGGAGAVWVLSCLIWGSGIATLAAFLTTVPVIELTQLAGWEQAVYSFGGAYPEEIGKALGVVVILMTFRGLNRPWHGLVTGALIGLGFEVNENIVYGMTLAPLDPSADWIGALVVWGVRIVVGPFIHILWTALAGWGIGLALFVAGTSVAWRVRTAAVWLLIPFVLHFMWNYSWDSVAVTFIALAVNALVLYALSIWIFIKAIRMARSDASYSFTPRPLTSVRDLPAQVMTPAPRPPLTAPTPQQPGQWPEQQPGSA